MGYSSGCPSMAWSISGTPVAVLPWPGVYGVLQWLSFHGLESLNQCLKWLGSCQYTVTALDSKSDRELPSQCGSRGDLRGCTVEAVLSDAESYGAIVWTGLPGVSML